MPTTTTTFEALLSGSTWNGQSVTGTPVFITFSFETAPAAYLTGLASEAFLASFRAFTDAEKANARQALQAWADASGVTFLEVPAGQGDIRFGSFDFSLEEEVEDDAGFAYYPSVFTYPEIAFDVPWGGDVFVDLGWATLDILLHEIGHALGLKHPHEGELRLDGTVDNLAHTVMTYNDGGVAATALGTLDIEAIRHLYGGPDADGTQVASWSWDSAAHLLTQTGGTDSDTIMGVGVRDVIAGGEGDDYVFSRSGDDLVTGGGGHDTLSGGEGADTLSGGAGDDELNGDDDSDSLSGGEGNDDIYGMAGDDVLDGGAGDDTLWGGSGLNRIDGREGDDVVVWGGGAMIVDGGDGFDSIFYVLSPFAAASSLSYANLTAGGGSFTGIELIAFSAGGGNDTITGGALMDVLLGNGGNDSLHGADNDDLIFGDSGADTLAGGAGDDTLVGGSGADVIVPGPGADEIWGESGVDTVDFSGEAQALDFTINTTRIVDGGVEWMNGVENIIGTEWGDRIWGDAAANQLFGRGGNDTIGGADGANYLRGDEGNDSIAGGSHFDDINGNMGNDTASGGLGGDWVVGGRDDDVLFGDDGDDIVYGNLGQDTCEGGTGADIVRGGQGDDVVRGGDGADWLAGDRGNDTVTGGAGADIFHTHGEAGIDRVTDFSIADGDRVNLLSGTTYTVAQVGADTVISMTGGGQMVLVGVSMSSLTGNWIFGA